MKRVMEYIKNYRNAIESSCSAGIFFDRKKVQYVVIKKSASDPVMFKTGTFAVKSGVFSGEINNENVSVMKKAADSLSMELGRSYAVISAVIPDPLVSFCGFHGSPAGDNADWNGYLRLKSAEKSGVKAEDVAFSAVKNTNNGIAQAYSFSMHRHYRDVINDSLCSAGLAASAVAPGAAYLLGCCGKKFKTGAGAVFTAEKDYWTLIIMNDASAPVYMVSRWFDGKISDDGALKEAVSEAERKIRAFVYNNKDFNVESMYVCAAQGKAEAVSGLLRERFNCECTVMDIPDGKNGSEDDIPFCLRAAMVNL